MSSAQAEEFVQFVHIALLASIPAFLVIARFKGISLQTDVSPKTLGVRLVLALLTLAFLCVPMTATSRYAGLPFVVWIELALLVFLWGIALRVLYRALRYGREDGER